MIGVTSLLPEPVEMNEPYTCIHHSLLAVSCIAVMVTILLFLFWRSELTLRKRAMQYRAIVENQTELIARFRPDGTLTFANAAYAHYFGSTPADIIGQNFFAFIPEEDHAAARSHLATLGPERTVGMYEHQVVLPNGERRWQQWLDLAILDSHGHVVEFQSVGRDITNRVRVEESLRESEARYRTVSELVSDYAYALVVQPDGTVKPEWVTDAFVHITGFTPEEAMTQGGWMPFIHPEDIAIAQQSYERIMSGQADVRELRIITRNGKVRWLRKHNQPVWDPEQGRVVRIYGAARDVTERKLAKLSLHESEARFRLIAEHIDEVFWLATADEGTILYVNPAYERLFGCSCASLYADPLSILRTVHPDDREQVYQFAGRCGKQAFELEYRVVRPDGSLRWVWEQNWPVSNEADIVTHIVGVAKDITERKTYEAQIERLASTDALTGLPNRRYLYKLAHAALQATCTPNSSVSLLYLDMNRFKAVNDTLGHDAGDALLMQLADRLSNCITRGDTLARLGGDEFAVLLPSSNIARARKVAEQMLAQLTQPFELHGQFVHLGGSIGIAIHNSDAPTFSTLLMQADIAMYRAKAAGSGIEVYHPALHTMPPDHLQMEAELRQALVDNGLILYYQPILDLAANQVVAVEALVRWLHPVRGLLTPDMFLPLAGEAGLLGDLDHWVLRAVLERAVEWDIARWGLSITINLTAQSLQRAGLVDEVATLVSTTGVPASQLIIELTEHTALCDLATTQRVLSGLKSLGLRIALDDFGTGYASLTHLRQLPVDVLKLDRSFAAGIGRDTQDEAVVRAMLQMGHGLQLLVIIEGIEHSTQLEWLRGAGGRYVQGYLIGQPVPPAEIVRGTSGTLSDQPSLSMSS